MVMVLGVVMLSCCRVVRNFGGRKGKEAQARAQAHVINGVECWVRGELKEVDCPLTLGVPAGGALALLQEAPASEIRRSLVVSVVGS